MDGLLQPWLVPSLPGLPVAEDLEVCFLAVKTEAEKFRYEIGNSLSFLSGAPARQQMVQSHFARLVFLSDSMAQTSLLAWNSCGPFGKKLMAAPVRTILVLEALQVFLVEKYAACCNLHQPVSLYAQLKTVKHFRRKLSGFSNLDGVQDNELVNIALAPIERLAKNNRPHLSFAEKEYLFRLLGVLIQQGLAASGAETGTRLLEEQLVKMNFNSAGFFDYLIRQVEEDIQKTGSLKDQVEKLYFHLKNTNQQAIDEHLCFNPKQKGVREFVNDWILEETTFLEKKLVLLGNPAGDQRLVNQGFKVVTELSVAQIACFVRLLVESGVIKNKNRAELITFYAVYTQSKKQENISPESFRTRFYNIEESARQEIRGTIIQLLNYINRMQ